ncbi:MAG: GNAT family N-acetyltransferase [Gemmatimonadaceae bacterium]|nr:GNAT family N-acetyltransferase [Gemmatimonadaceae bacterium]
MIELFAVPADDDGALLAMARELVGEYAVMPHTVPRWPDAAANIAALPQPFVPPRGALLVARNGDDAVGCGALLAYEPPHIAEIKRVYVRPSARGQGVGEVIMRALLSEAAARGFSRVRLDTAPELLAAQALYLRLGFEPIPQYRNTQLPGDVCFECDLTAYARSDR